MRVHTGGILHKEERGMVLPIVLVMLALGLLLATPTLSLGYAGLKAGSVTEDRAAELYAADSGIEEAVFWLVQGRPTDGEWTWDDTAGVGGRNTYQINGADVSVSIQTLPSAGDDMYRIVSVATGPNGTTTVLTRVWAVAGPMTNFDELPSGGHYPGDAYIEGNGTLDNSQSIGGDVYVTGDLTLHSSSQIEGSAQTMGDLTLNSWADVHGNLCVHGPPGTQVTFLSNCELHGDLYVTVDGTCTIDVQGNAHIHGDIYVDGSGTLTLKLQPNSVIDGDLYVQCLPGAEPGCTRTVTLNYQQDKGDKEFEGNEIDWDGVLPEDACPGLPVSGAAVEVYEIG